MDGPSRRSRTGASSIPARGWTKADILANNRLKLEIFRTFGVLPGSADTHVAEFFPWFVTPPRTSVAIGGCTTTACRATARTRRRTTRCPRSSKKVARSRRGLRVSLVAPLIDGLVSGKRISLPMNLPNNGQVTDLPHGVVVECMGRIEDGTISARDVASAGTASEHLRRVVASQELTVEAAIEGDKSLVLKAMLADPVAGSLPIEHVAAMTDEMLAATSRWLPQFG